MRLNDIHSLGGMWQSRDAAAATLCRNSSSGSLAEALLELESCGSTHSDMEFAHSPGGCEGTTTVADELDLMLQGLILEDNIASPVNEALTNGAAAASRPVSEGSDADRPVSSHSSSSVSRVAPLDIPRRGVTFEPGLTGHEHTGPLTARRAEDPWSPVSSAFTTSWVSDGSPLFRTAQSPLRRISSGQTAEESAVAMAVRRVLQLEPVTPILRLSEEDIKSLPQVTYGDQDQHECCICLEAYCPGEVLSSTMCNHVFHVACLAEWMRRATHCPLCRGDCMPAAAQPLFCLDNQDHEHVSRTSA